MKIAVIISTYGDQDWADLAWSRAYPSVIDQEADEVIVHHEPDLQIGPARNAAAEQAKSEYFIFLDADDELEPGYVAAMRAAMADRAYPTLYQPAVRYMRKGARNPNAVLLPMKDLRTDNYLVIGTMCPADVFLAVGGFSDYPHGFEDWSAWAKCWKAGCEIVPVAAAVYRAHINPRSKHRQMWRNRKLQVETHMRVQAELFPELA